MHAARGCRPPFTPTASDSFLQRTHSCLGLRVLEVPTSNSDASDIFSKQQLSTSKNKVIEYMCERTNLSKNVQAHVEHFGFPVASGGEPSVVAVGFAAWGTPGKGSFKQRTRLSASVYYSISSASFQFISLCKAMCIGSLFQPVTSNYARLNK